MKRIPAAKFAEQCLALLDRIDPDGIVITRNGKPVARLVPVQSGSADLIGAMKGKITVKGDIFRTGVDWNAQS